MKTRIQQIGGQYKLQYRQLFFWFDWEEYNGYKFETALYNNLQEAEEARKHVESLS